jgi:hypothetical protein
LSAANGLRRLGLRCCLPPECKNHLTPGRTSPYTLCLAVSDQEGLVVRMPWRHATRL